MRRRRRARAARTDLDPLFRFKVDFVRKRALPLVKGGAHVHARPGRRGRRGRGWSRRSPTSTASARWPPPAARCSTARPRCARRGRTRRRPRVAAEIDALKRWCASCLHDPAYQRLGRSSAFPRRSTTSNLVQVQRPRADLPEAMIGPDERLRRRDGFALTDARWHAARGAERDPLLRALPRARQGLVLEGAARQGRRGHDRTRSASRCAGCPLDEKISEMHMVRKAGDAIGALAHRRSSTTRCARAPATASATTA